jgi:pimeloyl-ACP methyl ester carboxylesterase
MALTTIMVFATAVSVSGAPATQPDALTVASRTTINWRPCADPELAGLECGRVWVPLDYDRPAAAKIKVKVARLRAADPANKLGTIFLNPGGPGGSGIDFLAGAGAFLFTDEVRARYDLVGFDPRGIARSTPLRCFDTFEESLLAFPPFAFPIGPEQEAIEKATTEYLADACASDAGRIIRHMSTANVARDLNVLRRAVGDRLLNYAGYSYGSYLGTVYANLFPRRVGRLVVDGILDPIAWRNVGGDTPFSERLRSDAGAQATLDEFFRLCDEAGQPSCAFAPQSSARFDAMAEKLIDTGGIVISDPEGNEFPFLYSDLVGSSLGPLYNSFSWPEQAAFLAYIEAQIFGLESAVGAAEADAIQSAIDGGVASAQTQEPYENIVEGFPGVACADTNNPDTYEVWPEVAAKAEAEFGYFGRLWTHASVPCWNWPGVDRDRYNGRFDRWTANPVLIATTVYDPATRYEGALTLNELLPNSALLTVEGWGHTTLFLSFCADAIVGDYFLTGAIPAPGTVCTQDFSPFPPLIERSQATGDAALVVDRQELRAEVLDEVSFVPQR